MDLLKLHNDFAINIIQKRLNSRYSASFRDEVISFLLDIMDFFFPHFSGKEYYDTADVMAKIKLLERDLTKILGHLNGSLKTEKQHIAKNFANSLPVVYNDLWNDARFIQEGDPAAECIDEVILAYPGFRAIVIYRIAHILYKNNVPIVPRIMTEYAHQITGVDIHPGAKIESPFFIDHGTGIVIGETTVIGKNVKIYQGVTLGALSVDKNMNSVKRHPTIENDVVIYAQAVILGGDTIIGKNSIIGGNSWVTQSIPPHSVVYNKSEVKVRTGKDFTEPINFII